MQSINLCAIAVFSPPTEQFLLLHNRINFRIEAQSLLCIINTKGGKKLTKAGLMKLCHCVCLSKKRNFNRYTYVIIILQFKNLQLL